MSKTPKSTKAAKKNGAPKPPKTKEWTLMFYFASDNELASSVVSQLKALKDAGHHPSVNVLAYFDPHVVGTPSHIFDINHVLKIQANGKSNIGFEPDKAFVRDLVLDKLWGRKEADIREIIRFYVEGVAPEESTGKYNPPIPTPSMFSERSPKKSFADFLSFCRKFYPARHYLLVILGHGQVVGHDTFLYDDNAGPSYLSLNELGEILHSFSKAIGKAPKVRDRGTLEMVGFHSCSMNLLEVAYQLRGAAKYMLASQGPAFVGSWPYKQFLIRLFKDLKSPTKLPVEDLVSKMFAYCFYNNTDFQLAGYAFDICLADLEKVTQTRAPIKRLANALIAGVNAKKTEARELIQLAHLDAQSFVDENYLDLFDFCFCLEQRCMNSDLSADPVIKEMSDASAEVRKSLEPTHKRNKQVLEAKLVVSAIFSGPALQYSNGLSIFFPWAEPLGRARWSNEYFKCDLHKQTDWGRFLERYFEKTKRETRAKQHENVQYPKQNGLSTTLSGRLLALWDRNRSRPSFLGQLAKPGPDHPLAKPGPDHPLAKPGPDHPLAKPGPDHPMGNPSGLADNGVVIKNYPRHT